MKNILSYTKNMNFGEPDKKEDPAGMQVWFERTVECNRKTLKLNIIIALINYALCMLISFSVYKRLEMEVVESSDIWFFLLYGFAFGNYLIIFYANGKETKINKERLEENSKILLN
jgi:hypothetical protein